MRCAVIQFVGSSGDSDCFHVFKNILNKPVEYVFYKESFAPRDFDLIILPEEHLMGIILDQAPSLPAQE